MDRFRRDKLRQKCEIEDGDLRIGQVRKRAVEKQLAQRARWQRPQREAFLSCAQQAEAEIQQVRRADKFECHEQPLGGAQDGSQAKGCEKRMAREADAHPCGGHDSGSGALSYGA